jgi:hypothetical protein
MQTHSHCSVCALIISVLLSAHTEQCDSDLLLTNSHPCTWSQIMHLVAADVVREQLFSLYPCAGTYSIVSNLHCMQGLPPNDLVSHMCLALQLQRVWQQPRSK